VRQIETGAEVEQDDGLLQPDASCNILISLGAVSNYSLHIFNVAASGRVKFFRCIFFVGPSTRASLLFFCMNSINHVPEISTLHNPCAIVSNFESFGLPFQRSPGLPLFRPVMLDL